MTFAPLLEAALEGTLRRSPPSVLPESSQEEPAELRLLRGAAYAGIRRLAGQVPGVDDTGVQLDPCPIETSPEAPAASVRRLLELMLNRRDLLPEWLELARARGVHLPPAVLPDVLDHVREVPSLQVSLQHVGGQRMAWLAMQNPTWSFAAPFDPLDRFLNGDLDERRRALRVLRRQDPRMRASCSSSRGPAKARRRVWRSCRSWPSAFRSRTSHCSSARCATAARTYARRRWD